MTVVRMTHVRQLNYCSEGVRTFCKTHGIDYMSFLKNGIDADELLRISKNDGLAVALVEKARGRR